MTRRNLLCSASTLALVAGCQGLQVVADVVTDPALLALLARVKILVDGLGVLPTWLTGLLSADSLARVSALVSQLVTLGRSIAAVTSIHDAVPLVGQLVAAVEGLLALVPAGATLTSPSLVELMSAAETYLPILLSLVGVLAAPRARRFATMTEARAEAILRAAAAR
jgi:hypothetical protein